MRERVPQVEVQSLRLRAAHESREQAGELDGQGPLGVRSIRCRNRGAADDGLRVGGARDDEGLAWRLCGKPAAASAGGALWTTMHIAAGMQPELVPRLRAESAAAWCIAYM